MAAVLMASWVYRVLNSWSSDLLILLLHGLLNILFYTLLISWFHEVPACLKSTGIPCNMYRSPICLNSTGMLCSVRPSIGRGAGAGREEGGGEVEG